MSKIPVMSQAEANRALGANWGDPFYRNCISLGTPPAPIDTDPRQHEQTMRFKIVDLVMTCDPQIDTLALLRKSDAIAKWVLDSKTANVDINVVSE